MKRTILVFTLSAIVLAALGAVTCNAANSLSVPQVAAMLKSGEKPVRIVCLGDSVTGVYYHTGGRRAWPDMLEIALNKIYPKAKFTVFNAGISGNATGDALARLDRDVIARKPHLVVIMFGLNDIGKSGRQKYRENLKTLISRCRQAGAAVILCTPNSVYPNGFSMPDVTEFAQIVRDVAKENSVPVADFFRAYANLQGKDVKQWMLLMSETIHPCMNGHKLFAETVAKTISGQRVSLADVPPLADSLRFTTAQLKAGKPIRVIAMAPYDRIVRDALLERFPAAQIQLTVWPVEGQSLSAIVKWAEQVRALKPNLVVVAVPANVEAKNEESFIHDYQWLYSIVAAFLRAEWDVLPILPSVTAPVAPNELHRADLARQIIVGHDFEGVDRKKNDTRSPQQILSEWIGQRTSQP